MVTRPLPMVQQPKLLDSSHRKAPTRTGMDSPSSLAQRSTIRPAMMPATPS